MYICVQLTKANSFAPQNLPAKLKAISDLLDKNHFLL